MSITHEILYGTTSRLQQLLSAGADPNEVDEYGFTPLIEAAIADSSDKAKVLLEYGADINQPDMVGRTALHWATDNHNIALTRLLLENHADSNAYSSAGQSVLVTPLLRGHSDTKQLLYQFGADLNFAQDYINGKLLGHRYELVGVVDIVNPQGQFIALNFEGFYLEFTLDIILNSLINYKNNFAARQLRPYFKNLQKIIDAFKVGAGLIRYQHYLIKAEKYEAKIRNLLNSPLLLIPVAHEGHALTFIKYKNYLARCDRGAQSKTDGSVVIYHMNNPSAFTTELIMELVYKRQTREFVYHGINKLLGAQWIGELPLPSQISGNCSWANVEACVPTMMCLLSYDETKKVNASIRGAMNIYRHWLDWDKNRSLYDCIQSFYNSHSRTRRVVKATILAAILFQRCNYAIKKDIERAEKIMPILSMPEYRFILENYAQNYGKDSRNEFGRNFMNILDHFGIDPHIA